MKRSSLSRPLATATRGPGPRSRLLSVRLRLRPWRRPSSSAALGYAADGWDPAHRPQAERQPADVVNLGYVVNAIEHPAEREQALRDAWDLARQVLVVSARLTWDARNLAGRPLGDGLITRTGTFQKFYEQAELAAWIEQALGVQPHAAAPGIFYVFRDPSLAQQFLASRVYRYRPRIKIDPHAALRGTP